MKKSNKNDLSKKFMSMFPTREWQQHYSLCWTNLVDETSQKNKVLMNTSQTVLDRFRRRRQITMRQALAGYRLKQTWFRAGLEARVTLPIEITPSNKQIRSRERLAIGKLDARRAWRRAITEVGQRLAPVLIHVCCEDQPPGAWASKQGGRGSTADIQGLAVLRVALDILADHYKLPEEQDTPRLDHKGILN